MARGMLCSYCTRPVTCLCDDAAINDLFLNALGYTYSSRFLRWESVSSELVLWDRGNGSWQVAAVDALDNAVKLVEIENRGQLLKLLDALGEKLPMSVLRY